MGAVALTALNTALAEQARSTGATAWIPPVPSQEQQEESTLLLAAYPQAEALADYETGPVPPPPVPAIIPEVYVDSTNAFPVPPLDANGCPYIAPVQMAALATLPYSGFAAISEPEGELPPLPEGYDVMPLAQGQGILVETEDTFRFRAVSTSNNVPVSFFGRVQRPSGYILPFNFTLNTTTPNSTFTTTPQCGKGLLLGCAASVPIGSITTGAVNAVAEIGRIQGSTFTPHTLLFSGQLDDLYPLTIDGGGLPTPSDRPTFQQSNPGGSSGTPRDITITPATGRKLRVTAVFFTMTTTAAAGDRTPGVSFRQGGVSYWFGLSGGGLVPSSSCDVWAGMNSGNSFQCPAGVSGGVPLAISLPESLYFYGAIDVRMSTNGPGGDGISNVLIRWEES